MFKHKRDCYTNNNLKMREGGVNNFQVAQLHGKPPVFIGPVTGVRGGVRKGPFPPPSPNKYY